MEEYMSSALWHSLVTMASFEKSKYKDLFCLIYFCLFENPNRLVLDQHCRKIEKRC